MNESQAIQLVTQYIYERTGQRVHISIGKIVGNRRQSELLQKAVEHIVEYYKGVEKPFG